MIYIIVISIVCFTYYITQTSTLKNASDNTKLEAKYQIALARRERDLMQKVNEANLHKDFLLRENKKLEQQLQKINDLDDKLTMIVEAIIKQNEGR